MALQGCITMADPFVNPLVPSLARRVWLLPCSSSAERRSGGDAWGGELRHEAAQGRSRNESKYWAPTPHLPPRAGESTQVSRLPPCPAPAPLRTQVSSGPQSQHLVMHIPRCRGPWSSLCQALWGCGGGELLFVYVSVCLLWGRCVPVSRGLVLSACLFVQEREGVHVCQMGWCRL